jgi:hypothetical protein
MASNRAIVDLEDITNTCFVVMPFHSLFGAEYERVIKPASEDVGLECVRQPTVVEETLTGRAEGNHLSLTGVTYTYLERGNSFSYSLDSFELDISEDSKTLAGEARLKHGNRDVVFTRLNNLAVDALSGLDLPS